jgi:hypothetical protein
MFLFCLYIDSQFFGLIILFSDLSATRYYGTKEKKKEKEKKRGMLLNSLLN